MLTSTIEVKGDKLLLDAYFDALSPEQDFSSERASYSVKFRKLGSQDRLRQKERYKILINITAKDSTAFRSVVNSISGLMSIVQKTYEAKN